MQNIAQIYTNTSTEFNINNNTDVDKVIFYKIPKNP